MTTIATICARGGSKGVPGKNVRPLLGKPLIVWSIEQAQACKSINGVYVSTDDPEIALVAENAGAVVPGLRPAELATDTAPKIPVIREITERVKGLGVKVEKVVDIDATSPLREVADIDACIALLTRDIDVVITAYESEKSPYFNMIERKPDGAIGLVKPLENPVARRQDAPRVMSMNASIYVWWEHTIDAGLFGRRTAVYEMPRERSIDIDAETDFELVEFYMQKKVNNDV